METRYLMKGVEIDDRTKEYIEKKLESIARLVDPITKQEIEIELDKKGKFRVEAMIETPYHLYRGENVTESIECSIDMAEEEIKSQIRKDKERHVTLKRRGGRSIKKKLTIDEAARF